MSLSNSATIHHTAIIEEGAIIGDHVTIGAYSIIKSGVTIKEGTSVASHVLIEGETTIGKNNRIFSHAVLGSIPQDLKYKGERTQLVIGDNNTIREFAFFNPGTEGGGGVTRIGDNNLFMGYVHLGHDVQVGNHCILANATNVAGHVEFGNHSVVGAMSGIHQFVKIGDYAMLAGASALTQDIPPYCMAEGVRATLRGLNINGLRRHMEREDIDDLKLAYRMLFEKGQPLQEVAQQLIQTSTSQKVIQLAKFIESSKRGIPFTRKINV